MKSFTDPITLGQILEYEQPTKYIVKSENYDDSYAMPVLTPGQTFILGYTDEKEGIYCDPLPVIIFDDFTTATKLVNFPFKVKSSAMKILKPANKNVYIPYWYYYLSSLKVDNDLHKRYWISTFASRQVNSPSFTEQKRIAERLDKVQELIALQKEQLKKLDELIKSRFIDLFGDPITNSENWELQQLVDIADVTSSKRIFEKEYVDSGIPFFRTKEIVELEQGLAPSTKIFITKARYDEIKAQFGIPQAGDLLISAVGTIGHIWIVPKDFSFYFKDGNLLWIKKPQYNSIFLRYLLPILVKHEISHVASGTAYQALTINKLGQTLVPLCPIKLQTQFADFVAKIEKQKGLLTTRLSHLETLYKSLMQEYFG